MVDADDIKNAELLAKYGFFKKGSHPLSSDFKKREKEVEKLGGEKLLKAGMIDMEEMEYRKGEFIKTSYPKPISRHVLSVVDPNYSFLEKSYLWILDHITTVFGYTKTMKITDTYGSSVGTDHWQIMFDRQRNVQRTITELMQSIGVLVKDIFPMIHELTMWDERLKWHEMADKGMPAGDKALKGAWTDIVEGGPENAGSIFGLARNAGFVTLPDMFFSAFVQKPEDVDQFVDVEMKDFGNQQVKSILKRKLVQYLTWKEHTKKEIEQRRRFTVRYLRQHITSIELNMSWLAPYLRQMKYLRENMNFQDDATMISTFDNAKFEIESLCTKKTDKKLKPVVLLNVQYLSTPERGGGGPYQYSSFQHSGSMTVTIRGYVWTDDQIESYKKMREVEAFELLSEFDAGFKAAMDELRNEIRKYIEAAEGELGESSTEKALRELKEKLDDYEKDPEMKKKKKQSSETEGAIYQPFVDVGSAFWEIGKMFIPSKLLHLQFGTDKKEFELDNKKKDEFSGTAKTVNVAVQNAFVNYRKAHRMITW